MKQQKLKQPWSKYAEPNRFFIDPCFDEITEEEYNFINHLPPFEEEPSIPSLDINDE